MLLPPGGRQQLLAGSQCGAAPGAGGDPRRSRPRHDLSGQIVVDDHLLRDVLTGARRSDLGGIASGLATTGLWLFRLSSSFADPRAVGRLSAPVRDLPAELQDRFRAHLMALPDNIEILRLHELAWPMAQMQHRHRALGHHLSAAMVEALAAAHELDAGIAVSSSDDGPGLRAAAEQDGIDFHVL